MSEEAIQATAVDAISCKIYAGSKRDPGKNCSDALFLQSNMATTKMTHF